MLSSKFFPSDHELRLMPETFSCHELFIADLMSAIDDYAKDGGPGAVWHLYSFYHDTLGT